MWNDLKTGKMITVASVIEFNETEERIKNILEALKKKIGTTEILEKLQTYIRFKTGSEVSIGLMF